MANHFVDRRGDRFVGQSPVARDGDGGDGAGVHEALDAGFLRGFEQAFRAADVALVDLFRMPSPQAVVGGDMKNALHTIHRARKRRSVAQIADDGLDVHSVERLHVAFCANEHPHPISALGEQARHMAAHKSRRTCNQNQHSCWKTSVGHNSRKSCAVRNFAANLPFSPHLPRGARNELSRLSGSLMKLVRTDLNCIPNPRMFLRSLPQVVVSSEGVEWERVPV